MFWSVRTWLPWTNKVSACRNALLRVSLKPLSTVVLWWSERISGVPSNGPPLCQGFLSDSCTYCCFSRLDRVLYINIYIITYIHNYIKHICVIIYWIYTWLYKTYIHNYILHIYVIIYYIYIYVIMYSARPYIFLLYQHVIMVYYIIYILQQYSALN